MSHERAIAGVRAVQPQPDLGPRCEELLDAGLNEALHLRIGYALSAEEPSEESPRLGRWPVAREIDVDEHHLCGVQDVCSVGVARDQRTGLFRVAQGLDDQLPQRPGHIVIALEICGQRPRSLGEPAGHASRPLQADRASLRRALERPPVRRKRPDRRLDTGLVDEDPYPVGGNAHHNSREGKRGLIQTIQKTTKRSGL
jgi:hypothetical protein